MQSCIARCIAFIKIALTWISNPSPPNHRPGCRDLLFVKHNHGFKKIASNTIQYIEASSSYCAVHLTSGTAIVVSVPLSEVVKLLPCDNFIRIHRSFSINLLHVDSFVGNTLVMDTGAKLPIGRDYRKVVIGCLTVVGTKGRR